MCQEKREKNCFDLSFPTQLTLLLGSCGIFPNQHYMLILWFALTTENDELFAKEHLHKRTKEWNDYNLKEILV
ncbi:MAG: hypothetical protein WBF33_20605, partial [Candidatus Nitrosopolaris sp.]